jgi:hypothetical protein
MKTRFFKITALTIVMAAGLAVTSCKGKTDEGDNRASDNMEVTDEAATDTTATAKDTTVIATDTLAPTP